MADLDTAAVRARWRPASADDAAAEEIAGLCDALDFWRGCASRAVATAANLKQELAQTEARINLLDDFALNQEGMRREAEDRLADAWDRGWYAGQADALRPLGSGALPNPYRHPETAAGGVNAVEPSAMAGHHDPDDGTPHSPAPGPSRPSAAGGTP